MPLHMYAPRHCGSAVHIHICSVQMRKSYNVSYTMCTICICCGDYDYDDHLYTHTQTYIYIYIMLYYCSIYCIVKDCIVKTAITITIKKTT